jgi:uncharacterized lipoprotein YehR (DUF1307 family)
MNKLARTLIALTVVFSLTACDEGEEEVPGGEVEEEIQNQDEGEGEDE